MLSFWTVFLSAIIFGIVISDSSVDYEDDIAIEDILELVEDEPEEPAKKAFDPDPKNLDPNFKPAEDDPRNIIFNNYEDWTIQANLERMVNNTFTLHLIELKDFANHVTLRAKLPSLEILSLSAKVKKDTGLDHWNGLEKIIFCRILNELDPSKVSIRTLYHGVVAHLATFDKFDLCGFKIDRKISSNLIARIRNKRSEKDEIVNLDFLHSIFIVGALETMPEWDTTTDFLGRYILDFDIQSDDDYEHFINAVIGYYQSPIANQGELAVYKKIKNVIKSNLVQRRGEAWFRSSIRATYLTLEAVQRIKVASSVSILDKNILR